MKQTAKKFAVLLLCSGILGGCESDNDRGKRVAVGGVEYGGVFRLNEVSDVRSLYPLEITESTGFRIASQVYQGLVKFNQSTLEIEPALAESWQPNEDATQWTFYLRKGVKFHDDPCFPNGQGREVTAEDVKWCVEQLCSPSPNNQMFWIVGDRLKGAEEYYNGFADSITGLEVLDEYTVRFTLNYSVAGLLQMIAHNGFFIYPKEALVHYGIELATHAVGTGPFSLEVFKPGEVAVLRRNPNYYGKDEHGNALPYLDAVQVSFVKDKKSELLMFRNNELDMVFTLPIEMYSEVLSSLADADSNPDFEPQVAPSMGVYYIAFQHQSEVFADVRVRRAFNLAVDKAAIVNHTLQGEGQAGVYGIVPPAFSKYGHDRLPKTAFDPDRARALLAEAGYPNGKGFPELTMQLASGGSNYELIAQVVAAMLHENLGVKVNLRVMPMAQLLDNAESGEATLWYDGWIADYPDPENFLRLFVSNPEDDTASRAYLNSVRYSNAFYDNLYKDATRQADENTRYEIYRAMDQILVHDAVVLPLYYEEVTRLIPTRVKNFPLNSIEYRDFSEVWISTQKAE